MATIDSNPYPLGFITAVPGIPVSLLVNHPELAEELSHCNLILVQAHSENLGRCFLGNTRLNLVTGQGLIYTLMGAGDSFVLGNQAYNVYRIADWRVDVEFPGDGVWAAVYVR